MLLLYHIDNYIIKTTMRSKKPQANFRNSVQLAQYIIHNIGSLLFDRCERGVSYKWMIEEAVIVDVVR